MKLFLPVFLLCIALWETKAQQSGYYLDIRGKVICEGSGLSGARVELFKKGNKTEEQNTSSSGRFVFSELPLSPGGDDYIIQISKAGHVTIKHWLSTKIPATFKGFPTYEPTVELFKNVPGLDKDLTIILEKPISKFSYNPRVNDFEDDRAYFSTIKAKVDRLFEILEAKEEEQYRLIARYRIDKMKEEEAKKAEAVKQAEFAQKKSEYERLVSQADKSYEAAGIIYTTDVNTGELIASAQSTAQCETAKDLYLRALEIVPGTTHPLKRIEEIDRVLAAIEKQKKEALASVEEKNKIQAVKGEAAETAGEPVKESPASAVAEDTGIAPLVPREEKEELPEQKKNIVDVLGLRERIEKEKPQEILQKREETAQQAITEAIISRQEIHDERGTSVAIARAREAEVEKSKAVKSQNFQRLLEEIALNKLADKTSRDTVHRISTPAAKTEPVFSPAPDRYLKDEKVIPPKTTETRKETVKLVHYTHRKPRLPIEEQGKPPKEISKAPEVREVKPIRTGREFVFKPKVTETKEEGFFTTIHNTIISMHLSSDTLKKVSYLWGAESYYKNGDEINEEVYKRERFKYIRN